MVRSKRRVQMDLIVHIISFFSTPIDVCHNSDMIMVGRLPYTHSHFLLFLSRFIPLLLFFVARTHSLICLTLLCSIALCRYELNRHAAAQHHYMQAKNMASFNRYTRYTMGLRAYVHVCVWHYRMLAAMHVCSLLLGNRSSSFYPYLFSFSIHCNCVSASVPFEPPPS